MPIDFPSSPTTGQQYTYGGVTYTYTAQGVWASSGGGGGFTSSGTAPTSPVPGDHWYDLTTGILAIYINDGNTSQWVQVAPMPTNPVGTPGIPGLVPPQGRLTLSTGNPVMTATQSSATIYYTPYCGNLVPIYNGTSWTSTLFAELSCVNTDTTKNPSAIGLSKLNDWFVWSDAGTLRLSHGPDWTSDTTRGAGTSITRVNGIFLNSASIANGPAASRGTYVGTTRSNASSTLDWIYGTAAAGGGAAFFGVWNMYNRVNISTNVLTSTGNWTPTADAVWRAAQVGSASYRASFVVGIAEDGFIAEYSATAGTANQLSLGVGYDVTNAPSGTTGFVSGMSGNPTGAGRFNGTPSVGFHFVSALEWSQGSGDFYGTAGGATGQIQGGLTFSFRM